jgi:hypothetical protein
MLTLRVLNSSASTRAFADRVDIGGVNHFVEHATSGGAEFKRNWIGINNNLAFGISALCRCKFI